MDHNDLLANLNQALEAFANDISIGKDELKEELETFRDDVDSRIQALEEEIEEELSEGEDGDNDNGEEETEAEILDEPGKEEHT
jgi:Skp family chaperone for outer membrane proteins